MGCHIVSEDHIDLLVSAMLAYKVTAYVPDTTQPSGIRAHEVTPANATDTGRALLRENVACVSWRYADSLTPDEIGAGTDYQHRRVPLDGALAADPAVAVLKACSGYAYSASEHAAWPGSLARHLVDALTVAAIEHLRGFDAADTWEYRRPRDQAVA